MSETRKFIAFDLGAESGRAVVGQFDGDRLALSELHRFANGPVRVLGRLHWDALRLFAEITQGLMKFAQEHGPELAGMGVDTWGVDSALIEKNGALVGNPYHYRDSRTDGMYEEAFKRVPRAEIFRRTGIQFMEINTLYQLLSMVLEDSPWLEAADTLLMMPDLFNYWLTGRQVCEFTEATTSQLYDPRQGAWSEALFDKLGLPTDLLAEIVPPGTVLDTLHPSVGDEVGLADVPVIAPACHDTGSAVAAVPARGEDYAYISSGTWSLMGIEVQEPIITEESLAYNFTNEGGVCDTFRFLKNIMGLWLVQECRRIWSLEGESLSYDELTRMAAQAEPFQSVVDPDAELFLRPGDMPSRMQTFCQDTGQPVPETKGALVRCALESLACTYRWTLESLEKVTGREIRSINIVGGGGRNKLLNQLTADITGLPVTAGPFEATAIGNILMQALATGHIASLEEGRELVRRSFDVTSYEPRDTADWEAPYETYLRVAQKETD
jgi:rhamnulokinase